MFCGYCRNQLDANSTFYNKCEKNVFEKITKKDMKFYIKCGAKFSYDAVFCEKCGFKKQDYSQKDEIEKKRKNEEENQKTKGLTIISLILIVLIAFWAILISE